MFVFLVRINRDAIVETLFDFAPSSNVKQRGLRVLRPSFLGIHDEARVDAHCLELPDAALLHELVLVDRLAPQRQAAGGTSHADVGPACAGGAAVGLHRHDGL